MAEPLTEEEQAALILHRDGLTNKEIAEKMGISTAKVGALLKSVAAKGVIA